jgi:hypothetical protein
MTDRMPEPRPRLVDVAARLEDKTTVLAAVLAMWVTRDDSKAQPEVTRAGHTAVEAIDAMLAELHQARQQLVGEVREHQDAAVARVDALLARHRNGAACPAGCEHDLTVHSADLGCWLCDCTHGRGGAR